MDQKGKGGIVERMFGELRKEEWVGGWKQTDGENEGLLKAAEGLNRTMV